MIFGPYAAVVHPDVAHDGDTVYLDVLLRRGRRPLLEDVDLGFGLHLRKGGLWAVRLPVRLLGIDAPELATPAGKAALQFLRTIVVAGSGVKFESHGWDKYGGRALGKILIPGPSPGVGADLADLMTTSGHAQPWDGRGPKPNWVS